MKIYSVLQIGEYHLNHCEDYLFYTNIGKEQMLLAVMDGCTMATDSYLVSTITGKILRKIAKELDYKVAFGMVDNNHPLPLTLKLITHQLFIELKAIANQLMLEKNELMTTIVLLLVDTNLKNGVMLAAGDGVVCVNGEVTEFDQGNKPDYIGYHLNKDFEDWYKNQKQIIFFTGIRDISIATDGLLSFERCRKPEEQEAIMPVDYLLKDVSDTSNGDMLYKKLKHLEYVAGLKPTDDLAIVRLIL